MENSIKKKERLEKEEKTLQKQLEKAKNDDQKAEINAKIKTRQEQIEKLEQELNSQLETQELITQVETQNIKNNPYV